MSTQFWNVLLESHLHEQGRDLSAQSAFSNRSVFLSPAAGKFFKSTPRSTPAGPATPSGTQINASEACLPAGRPGATKSQTY